MIINGWLLKKYCLYFILLTAFLNADLRISADSKISLFRLLLPFAVLLIAACSMKILINFFLCLFVLGIVGLIQHYLTVSFFYATLPFDFLFFIEYYFHYSCILIIFFILLCLKKIEGVSFKRNFVSFSIFFLKSISIFILVYTVVMGNPLKSISAENINNIGCMLVAGMSFLLVIGSKDKTQYIWCVLIIFLLLANDCKAAFFGSLIEIIIVFIIRYATVLRRRSSIFVIILLVTFVLFGCFFIARDLIINGYPLMDLIFIPIQRVLNGEPFPTANTSITYRTNSTIEAFGILSTTCGVGVGFGNTGRILVELMGDTVYDTWLFNTAHSLHNWWLELMCDFGWGFIFIGIYVFLKEVYLFFSKNNWETEELQILVFVLSFPVWSISASGLTTGYYTLSILFFTLINFFNLQAS